jgi:hypothetical protein
MRPDRHRELVDLALRGRIPNEDERVLRRLQRLEHVTEQLLLFAYADGQLHRDVRRGVGSQSAPWAAGIVLDRDHRHEADLD